MGLGIRPSAQSLFALEMLFHLVLFLGGAATAEKNKTQRHYYTASGFPQTSPLGYGLGYQGNGGYPLYVNYQQQAVPNQNLLQSSVVQVPQTGLVPANTLAGTYGTGTYGTGTYGTGAYGTYGAGLYGSSLPFLPSVFYRTRTRLAPANATIGADSNQEKTLGLDTTKVSKDDN